MPISATTSLDPLSLANYAGHVIFVNWLDEAYSANSTSPSFGAALAHILAKRRFSIGSRRIVCGEHFR
jgi:hypothetical protein